MLRPTRSETSWTGRRSSWPRAHPDPARGAARPRAARSSTTEVPASGTLMTDVTNRLRELYRTERRDPAADVQRHRRTGIGDPEPLLARATRCFVPLAGFFSQRWQRLATAYGLTVHTTEDAWGTRLDPAKIAAALAAHPGTKAVLLTQSETSTGVIQPIEELAGVAREAGVLVVVDVVSSLGAVPFAFDDWGIDVAVGGSQKALSASPGIAFVAISDRARDGRPRPPRSRGSTSTGASTERSRPCPIPENPWTPAISVMQGLHAALELYFQDGVDVALGAAPDAEPGREGRSPRDGPGPVRRGPRGQLDRDGDPRARGHRRRHDQRPDPLRLRLRPRARARAAQGHGVPDRALRLRQRARHHPRTRGARDDPRTARVPGQARRRRRGRRAGVPGGAAERARPRHRDPVASRGWSYCARTSRSTCAPTWRRATWSGRSGPTTP